MTPPLVFTWGFFISLRTTHFSQPQLVLFAANRFLHIRCVITINFHQPKALDVNISFPSEWNELTPFELRCFAKQVINARTREEQVVNTFLDLLQSRTASLQKTLPNGWLSLLNNEDCARWAEGATKFLFEENNLTNQPFETLNIKDWRGTRYYGPQSAFDSLTCGEFEACEVEFLKFIEYPNYQFLANIAAMLWRPKDIEWMWWSKGMNKYITYDWEHRAKDFAKLSNEILFVVFTWYSGCRQLLPRLFPLVYEGGTGSNTVDLLSFTKCIHSAAGPKNGNRTDIRLTLVKEFFFEMNEEARKAKELEAQYKNLK